MSLKLAPLGLVLCLCAAGKQLVFEKNAGQAADRQANFLIRTASGLRLEARSGGGLRFLGPRGEQANWSWIGANSRTSWQPAGSPSGSVSYYLGKNPAGWFRDVPAYSKIVQRNLYPGIDLTLYGADANLEYDLVIQPGANPSRIRLQISGASLDPSGNIKVGGLLQRPPSAYQVMPDGQRISIPTRFIPAHGKNVFRLEIARYRSDLPLIVDPVIVNSWIYSGNVEDVVVSVFPHAVVGYTRSTLWDRPSTGSDADIFIRTDSGLTSSVTYWGGSGDDIPIAAYLDQFGYFYVAGSTNSQDFPTSGAAAQTAYGGGATDGFLLAIGGTSILSSYVGGSGDDRLTTVLGSALGSIVFTGETNASAAIIAGSVPYSIGTLGGTDAFVGAAGVSSLTITAFGGQGDDHVTGLVSLGHGIYALAGYTTSPDFPTATPYQSALKGSTNGWLAQMNLAAGQPASIQTATYWGGSGADRINALALGNGNELIAGGTTTSSDFPALSAARSTLAGPSDGFILRFNSTTWQPTGSSLFGGSGDDSILALAVTSNDDVIAGGSTTSQDLQVPGNVLQAGYGGAGDGFVAQLDRSGMPVWASYLGGPGLDQVVSLAFGFADPAATGPVVRIGGNTASAAWLSIADPTFSGSSQAGFAIDAEIAFVGANDVIVGKDLEAPLSIQLGIPTSSSGIVTLTSSDPSKLLLFDGTTTGGTSALAYAGTSPGASGVYAQGLVSSGTASVIISGAGIPQRTLNVMFAPSVVSIAPPKTATVPVQSNYYNVVAQFQPLDPLTSQPLAAEPVRTGVNSTATLVVSDSTGITPDPNNPLTLDLLQAGSYSVQVSSPVFNTLPGDSLALTVTSQPPPSAPVNYIFVPNGAEFGLTGNVYATLTFTSSDPTKIQIQKSNDPGFQASVTVTGPGFARVLSDQGFATIEIQNSDGSLYGIINFAFGSPEIDWEPHSITMPVGGTASVTGQLMAIGDPPAGYQKGTYIPLVLYGTLFQEVSGSGIASVKVGGTNQGTILNFSGVTPGNATVDLPTPANVPALTPPTLAISVIPPSVVIGDSNDLVLAQGYYQWYYVIASGPQNSTVQLQIADPTVAYFGNTQTPSTYTFSASPYWAQIPIYGIGPPGSSTTITITYAGNQYTASVRILPVYLKPVESLIKLNGAGTVDLLASIFDPKRGQTLSAGQPIQGLQTIDVVTTASNGNICVFPQTADPGRYSYAVAVTCTGQGSVIAQFSSPPGGAFTTPPPTAAVQLSVLPNPPSTGTSDRVYVGNQMQTMGEYSPYYPGPVATVTSGDPSKVLVSASQTGPFSASIQTTSNYYIQGLASEGAVRLALDHSDTGVEDEVWVYLMPSTIAFDQTLYQATTGNLSASSQTIGASMRAAIVTQDLLPFPFFPGTSVYGGPAANTLAAGTNPFLVSVNNDNPAVAIVQPPAPILSGLASSASINIQPLGYGDAHLSITQPPGFVPTPGTTVRVSEPTLALSGGIVLGKDLQQAISIYTTPSNSTPPAQITITSLDPDKVLVSTDPAVPGAISATGSLSGMYLQALTDNGTALLRVSASGLADLNLNVELLPVTLTLQAQNSGSPANTGYVSASLAPIRGQKVVSGYYGVRPGVTGAIELTSSDPTIIAVNGAASQPLSGLNGAASFGIQYVQPGTAQLTVATTPSTLAASVSTTVTVGDWSVYFNVPSTLPAFLTSSISLGNDALSQPPGQLTANPNGAALFSLTAAGQGATVLQIPGGTSSIYIDPVGAAGVSVSLSFMGLNTAASTGSFQIVAPQFVFNYPNGNVSTPLSAGSVTVRISLGAGPGDERPLAPGQPPVSVNIQSSNPAVAAGPSVQFNPGDLHHDVTIPLLAAGTTILTLQPPAGFAAASSWNQILVVVQ